MDLSHNTNTQSREFTETCKVVSEATGPKDLLMQRQGGYHLPIGNGQKIMSNKKTNRSANVAPSTPKNNKPESTSTKKKGKPAVTKEKSELVPLTPEEVKDLKSCENTIDQGWQVFTEIGEALRDIRDKRLYKAEYKTFEEYVHKRWEMGRQHAYRQINAVACYGVLAEEAQQVDDMEMPANESQLRPLSSLEQEQWVPAWKQVLDKAKGEKITAAMVGKVVQEMSPKGDKVASQPAVKVNKDKGANTLGKVRSFIADTLKKATELTREQLTQALQQLQAMVAAETETSA